LPSPFAITIVKSGRECLVFCKAEKSGAGSCLWGWAGFRFAGTSGDAPSGVSVGWDALAFALCLVGFFFLVFANAREGRRLLHRPANGRERRICAAAGRGLTLALWVCVRERRGNFGSAL
jgi:hypothetical protein